MSYLRPKNHRFVNIGQEIIPDRIMEATICLKIHLKINISELHSINEFWYNHWVYGKCR